MIEVYLSRVGLHRHAPLVLFI